MSSTKNLEFQKTTFLTKSNSAFIEEMYMKFVNNDPTLPDSWKGYFYEIGDELDVIVNEINGPSWGPAKRKIDILSDKIRDLKSDKDMLEEERKKVQGVSLFNSPSQTPRFRF